jgi:hypothetical protein
MFLANIFFLSTLWLYHGLSRSEHNDFPLKLAFESPNYNFKTKKTNKQNRFQELIHPEDHELVNVFGKYIFSLYFVALPWAFKEQAQ